MGGHGGRAGGVVVVAERRRLSVTPLKSPDMYRQTILVPTYVFLYVKNEWLPISQRRTDVEHKSSLRVQPNRKPKHKK